MKTRKSFLLRIDPALHAELERWAAQELRSLNGQIEYILKEAVARRKQPFPPSHLTEEEPAGDGRESAED